ncbi:ThiF family adenylyltransferase [Paenibacillus spongiae]|uniref:ThiF family adenylyltransferase n=1 Tax=Paenibacillus spongiae TaxID=2909671 RepID=A0ABY5S759_9BACL|nr:ThiF family adenylyltransferase [Paenibacillus spongiae]UVI28660.1 ThiF family adenylyltransferase [Paenibacillus spongiae]
MAATDSIDEQPSLSDDAAWSERYSRQTRFAPIGTAGQNRLRKASVLIVGCGALGASLAQHMVRAGVGTVRIVDRDYVEPSNLQRQVLFDEEDARSALPKAVAAANKLRRINSDVAVEPYVADVTAQSAVKLTEGVMLVLDGTDNVPTRLAMSDTCFRLGIPLLYGGIAGSHGMSATLIPGETACLRCLIGGTEEDHSGETCDTIGVISPIVDWIAALQAAEALKWLAGAREAIRRTWLSADLWPFRLSESAMPKPSSSCPCCSTAAIGSPMNRGGDIDGQAYHSNHKEDIVGQVQDPLHVKESAAQERRSIRAKEIAAKVTSAIHASTSSVEERALSAAGAKTRVGKQAEYEKINRRDDAALQANGNQSTGLLSASDDPIEKPVRSVMLCGRDSVQVSIGRTIDLVKAQQHMAACGMPVTANPYLVRVQIQEGELLALFPDGRILVQGTQDTRRAEALCERYVSAIMAADVETAPLNGLRGREE